MSQKSSIEFYVTVFKNGAVVKRSSFVKPYLVFGSFPKSDFILRSTKGEDLISGISYWNGPTQFVFFDYVLQQSHETAAESEAGSSRVSFEIIKDPVKIQIRSVLVGEPPKIKIPTTFLKPKTEDKKAEKKRHWRMLLLLMIIFSGAVWIFNVQGPKEEAVNIPPAAVPPAVGPMVQKVDKSPFLRVLQKNRGDIEQCQFEHPFQNGTVKYRAIINTKGKISELSVLSDNVSSEPILGCLNQRIKTWTFPATANSDQTLFFALKLQRER